MKDEDHEIAFIEANRYLTQRMSPDERAAFEQRLESDDSLRIEVERLRGEIAAVQEYGLRKELDSIHSDLYGVAKKSKVRSFYLISGIAASMVIAFGLWLFIPEKQATPQELYAQNFEVFPNLISVRDDHADSSKWVVGMRYYSEGNYSKCVELLEFADYPSALEPDILFYKALSFMAIENYQGAIGILKKLQNTGEKYHQQVPWYMGLSYLAKGDEQSAITQFNTIKENEFEYLRARQLLSQIE